MSCSASAPQWPPKPGEVSQGGAALGVPSVGLPTVPQASVSLSGVMEASQAPPGLAKLMADSRAFTASRFWIVDNSGSMASPDGSKRVPRQDGTFAVVKSTRWEELRDVVHTQARLAEAVQSRADFHLLNSPGGGARQFLSLGMENSSCPSAAGPAAARDLEAAMATGPRGTTPLTEAVRTIHGLLERIAPAMRGAGHVAVVVIATDGLPDHPESFVRAVVDLQRLGCTWLVVRLCTDSDDVIDYWNDLDRQLEAPLEVLDDPAGEAKEVQPCNPVAHLRLPPPPRARVRPPAQAPRPPRRDPLPRHPGRRDGLAPLRLRPPPQPRGRLLGLPGARRGPRGRLPPAPTAPSSSRCGPGST